ncbi:histidine phosphatase family protein [Mycetocola zhadangensis]|uniref:Histidine phosphatase family protein n=1 Tax=Mycetocola zhadangensis TaxID=1164595 RepID=A0A3L7ISB7_9MICO|nr:histidine phosphatase family protein [Mycetocola zhadangensis]RLQ81124.1 histidine phosphatase family protein [Mycetocola zhadangensis]GGF04991.1 isomerase [Mycetocola zhadangensis]
MRILLIRHGQTPANVLGLLDTAHPGPGLTKLGHQQASAVPDALADENIEGVFASTLRRTQLTAEPLARARRLGALVTDGLHEISAGALEGLSDEKSQMTYVDTVFSWAAGDLSRTMPGGSDGHEFFGRFDGAIDAIAREHSGTVAIVSHGAAIRTWTGARAVNVDVDYAATHPLSNTGVVDVTGSPSDGWRVSQWDGNPIGGRALLDVSANDPTGDALR